MRDDGAARGKDGGFAGFLDIPPLPRGGGSGIFAAMNASQFVAKWRATDLSERSAAQQHFLDLCDLVEHPKPAAADPTGESFTFERGAAKHGSGDGWADVWRRGFFGWEYKGRHKDLVAAYDQLLPIAVKVWQDWGHSSGDSHPSCTALLVATRGSPSCEAVLRGLRDFAWGSTGSPRAADAGCGWRRVMWAYGAGLTVEPK